ncbi:putative F-box protein PP2-B12 [Abeliophyllum distichum]|uniref:F-box protein PP2-B12 n=1 Tax=Abeliophyllum distichum TaxID=126358 RepID=A0ABD1RTL0_9LAMI
MSEKYDNWERLVKVVLRREQLRQVALYSSREPSFNSISSSFISEPATPILDQNIELGSSSNTVNEFISEPATPIHEQNIQLGSSSNTVNETDWDRFKIFSLYVDIANVLFALMEAIRALIFMIQLARNVP